MFVDVQALYTTHIKPLAAVDRLRLLAIVAQDLSQPATEQEQAEKLTIDEHLARANYQGGALFKTAEEVDTCIRVERDAWGR